MAIKRWIGTDGSYSTNGNWSAANVPVNADTVRLGPDRGTSITSGLNQSAVDLAAFYVDDGFGYDIASAVANLQISTAIFRYAGLGQAFIDLGSTAVSPVVDSTGSADEGENGLYLIGSGIAVLTINGGDVGVAAQPGDTATVTTLRVNGTASKVDVGAGTSLTNLGVYGGRVLLRAAGTTVNVYGGELNTREIGAITTLNIYGGRVISESTGTITTVNLYGGILDMSTSNIPRTITTMNQHARTQSEFIYDPAVITITNALGTPERPVRKLLIAN